MGTYYFFYLVPEYFLDVPNMPVKLGKLNDLSKFDAEFFGFHLPHRVKVMEPMSRIILEKSYEALVDSGRRAIKYTYRRQIRS